MAKFSVKTGKTRIKKAGDWLARKADEFNEKSVERELREEEDNRREIKRLEHQIKIAKLKKIRDKLEGNKKNKDDMFDFFGGGN